MIAVVMVGLIVLDFAVSDHLEWMSSHGRCGTSLGVVKGLQSDLRGIAVIGGYLGYVAVRIWRAQPCDSPGSRQDG